MSSFISEHTAEFYLVPRFTTLLHSHYKHVLSFFFWKTREGASLSHLQSFPESLVACAMFPRRPKLDLPGADASEGIGMKLNHEVSAMSIHLQRNGIPTFLGFPLVSSIRDFAFEFECAWYATKPEVGVIDDHYSFQDGVKEHESLHGPFGSGNELCEFVRKTSRHRLWGELLNTIYDAHSQLSIEGRFMHRFVFGASYKPVYFVMW